MVTRSFQTELKARNLAMAHGIVPSSVIDWDAGAWRGPRVLVPIVVEALPVSAAAAAGASWAAVGIDPLNPAAPRPGPFDTTTGTRPAGVHLHWALPDGLTRGERPAAASDAALPASANPRDEQPESREAPRTRFTPVPDRWLVVRVQAGATASAPRRASAWVISGALDPARRSAVPLSQWKETRPSASEVPPVTAMGPGEPTFAVYYDNTRQLLAFHDPLTDAAQGPLTYLVCGWYGRLEDDPLYAPGREREFLALLKRLGWSLDAAALQSLHRSTRDELLKQTLLGDGGAQAQKMMSVQPKARTAPAFGLSPGAAAAEAPAPVNVNVGRGAARWLQFGEESRVDPTVSKVVYATPSYFDRYWPRQMLCHGAVFDVAWNGRGGGFDLPEAGVPPPGAVSVAVGQTSAQALAALAARESGDASQERLLDAFACGAMSDLSQPSGLARLESQLHAEDFSSRPGGFVVDTLEQGDAFVTSSGAESPPAPRASGGGGQASLNPAAKGLSDVAGVKVRTRFYRADSTLQMLHDAMGGPSGPSGPSSADRPAPAGSAPASAPRTRETVRRAMPRWYQPRDPVLLLRAARRAYKHGEDALLDGTLGCRLSGQTIRQLSVNPWAQAGQGNQPLPLVDVVGADLSTDDLKSGQIPAECGALFHETLLLDPTVVTRARELVVQRSARLKAPPGTETRAVSAAVAGQRVLAEQTLLFAATLDPTLDTQALAALSTLEGTMPRALALQFWRRPWTPIELAWEVEWYPSPGAERDWLLTGTDLALRGSIPTGTEGAPALTLRGRSILTPAIARTLEKQLKRFLDDEASGARDDASPDEEADLARVMRSFASLDVLGASLAGLHDTLMARAPVPGVAGAPAPDAWQPISGQSALWLLRAGHLRLRRARIVDAFGQFHDVAPSVLDTPVRAVDLVSRAGPAFLGLPPRLQEPSRLMFRLLDAADDAREATRQKSPVCGWLVPDHLDEAIEVFDQQGQPQGQLQPAEDGRTLEWQGVPGLAEALGAPPVLANPALGGFVQGLLQHGLRDKARLAGPGAPTETALAALLRMIDATLWTTDPVGREGNEHLSLLVGHPLALVRAELRLEVQAEPAAAALQAASYLPARAELERTPLTVRLGELLALDDGLMGYFVNDDYSRFFPVHEALAPQARPAGPGEGYLGSMALPPQTAARPLEHPYVDRTPFVEIRPGQRLRLTLVLDPRGAVHATCGFLPRKKIELMREHVAPALEALAFTFRIGPVLVDPDAVRMPVPAEIAGGWSWVRRVNVTTWQEDKVVKASQDALLGDAPAMLQEGWLKLSGSLKPSTPG
ncbi:MAG: hypothetical protein JNJ71_09710 [Rubrivivax sp.]|nr:hypothetical protein [Rubrivivax sp.]